MEKETMKKFVEIEDRIIALDAIVSIYPAKDGKVLIKLLGDVAHTFSEESVAKLKTMISQDCFKI